MDAEPFKYGPEVHPSSSAVLDLYREDNPTNVDLQEPIATFILYIQYLIILKLCLEWNIEKVGSICQI